MPMMQSNQTQGCEVATQFACVTHHAVGGCAGQVQHIVELEFASVASSIQKICSNIDEIDDTLDLHRAAGCHAI